MYKRLVRLLFVHRPADPEGRRAAAVLVAEARAFGAWIEARRHPHPPPAEALAWADLILTLGDCPALPCPPHAQHRHWPETNAIALARRLAGVVGGLRLLARMDASRDGDDKAE